MIIYFEFKNLDCHLKMLYLINCMNVLTLVDLDVSEFDKAPCTVCQAAGGARKTELSVSDQTDTGTLLQVQAWLYLQLLFCKLPALKTVI